MKLDYSDRYECYDNPAEYAKRQRRERIMGVIDDIAAGGAILILILLFVAGIAAMA